MHILGKKMATSTLAIAIMLGGGELLLNSGVSAEKDGNRSGIAAKAESAKAVQPMPNLAGQAGENFV